MEQINNPEYAPTYSVTAEGKDISRALRECLSELTLTDNGGATAKADELKITLHSETLALPQKGARLRLGLGFNDKLTDKGWFVVSGVSSSGPPRRIEIYATAAPMNSQKQTGDVQSHKTRSWDDIQLADIVKTVATDNGLTAKVASKFTSVKVDHIDQVAESDASLMTRLAKRYNAVSKPSGGYWLFLEQGAAVTASGKSTASVTVTPPEVSSWSYSEGERGSTEGKASTSAGAGKKKKEGGKISVRYFDEADGKTKTSTVDHDGPSLSNPWTQAHKNAADQHAQSKKTQANRNERKMTITGPARLKHIPLTAESRVITAGFGEREDRNWLVESLVFNLTSAGLSYSWNLVVDIKHQQKAEAKKKKSSGKDKTGPNYFG